MREVTVVCPVCGDSILVGDDEQTPSGTCRECGTRVELPLSAFAVLAAHRGASTALPSPQPQARPRSHLHPQPQPESQPQAEPEPQPEPQPPRPAAPQPLLRPRPAAPSPKLRAPRRPEPKPDFAQSEGPKQDSLDLFEDSPRGIVGAYFNHRKHHARAVPRWLLIWLGVLALILCAAVVLYTFVWTG